MDGYRFAVGYGSAITTSTSCEAKMKCLVFVNTSGTIRPNGPQIKIILLLKIKILHLVRRYLQHLFTLHKVQISSRYLIDDIGSNILKNWLL